MNNKTYERKIYLIFATVYHLIFICIWIGLFFIQFNEIFLWIYFLLGIPVLLLNSRYNIKNKSSKKQFIISMIIGVVCVFAFSSIKEATTGIKFNYSSKNLVVYIYFLSIVEEINNLYNSIKSITKIGQ